MKDKIVQLQVVPEDQESGFSRMYAVLETGALWSRGLPGGNWEEEVLPPTCYGPNEKVECWRDADDTPEDSQWVIAEYRWKGINGTFVEPSWFRLEENTFFRADCDQPILGEFIMLRWQPLPKAMEES